MLVEQPVIPAAASKMCALFLLFFPSQPALRSGAIDTVTKRQIIMNGPLRLVTGVPPPFGTISRIPIFLDNVEMNETWGTNKTSELEAGG